MLDHNNKDLIEKAFEIAAKDEKYAGAHIEINGKLLAPYDDDDSEVLAMLALSPVREKLEELRDFLYEVLGKRETSPEEQVIRALCLLTPYLHSGFIKSIRSEGGTIIIEKNK